MKKILSYYDEYHRFSLKGSLDLYYLNVLFSGLIKATIDLKRESLNTFKNGKLHGAKIFIEEK